MARQQYKLVVSLLSASLIHKNYKNVEFEISIGNFGNKFDADVEKACSVTEAINPVYDGKKKKFFNVNIFYAGIV